MHHVARNRVAQGAVVVKATGGADVAPWVAPNAATFVVLALLLVGHLRTVEDRLWDTANALFEARLDD